MSLFGRLARTAESRSPISPYQLLRQTSKAAIDVHNPGTNVFERDWDVLVVLDACRADMFDRIGPEFGYDDAETTWSVANMSDTWMERTFTDDHRDAIEQTAYVSGNPFTRFHDWDVSRLDEVWTYAWDDEVNGVPARPITDRALSTWHEQHPAQMIVHYMQPHFPSFPHPTIGDHGDLQDFGHGWDTVWNDAGDAIPWDTVQEAYDDNLRYVLEDVELLLDNLDAETVAITADHGNSLGTLGIRGHPKYVLLPEIRRVPWVEVEGRGPGHYEPSTEREQEDTSDDAVQERLDALGYA